MLVIILSIIAAFFAANIALKWFTFITLIYLDKTCKLNVTFDLIMWAISTGTLIGLWINI